jgi:hypothetical protein
MNEWEGKEARGENITYSKYCMSQSLSLRPSISAFDLLALAGCVCV